mmetsp:Transcript_2232/g.3177  ORF Transcript_2232/g.3177 Transcript_2232/m.3177 type:complete len:92 (-) Transcript_2232:190-465(-)|eukprot:CAMPEP_0203666042 /NCGR_PEP_ID=MMETSP0090-20130426/3169_1 /ASSEMBLY_ACC=CAM_ASM_001088 /TAXON_ID=426623 /ORGANISM="Chaetoceros affinis, Strain CCMP159" /LENGTH=91 /DNA_ID=CAMNT_0050529819 /DNA_START=46 /DNA_END=321 /DNA_ORIENTATION=-
MKFIAAATVLLATSASAFVPVSTPFGVAISSTSLDAKHVQNKAARKANHNRPRKSRPSDINRKPVVYPSFEKPAEYTISDAPAAPAAKAEA